MAYDNACCLVDLFEHPEAESLEDLGFEAFLIPEAMVGLPFYNPLFFTDEERNQLELNGLVVRIRSLYTEIDYSREKADRISFGRGFYAWVCRKFHFGFFGYSTHTTEDIEHVNANQDHIGEVEQHVELAEKFAKAMREEANQLEGREFMVNRLLHVSTSMQSVFETYKLMMAELSVLFQQRALSPLLVERKEVIKKMRALQHKERGRGNII